MKARPCSVDSVFLQACSSPHKIRSCYVVRTVTRSTPSAAMSAAGARVISLTVTPSMTPSPLSESVISHHVPHFRSCSCM